MPQRPLAAQISEIMPESSPRRNYNRLTPELKAAILEEMSCRQWSTAREAYGWAWTHLGLRTSYLTLWRFFDAHGLFQGSVARDRKLTPPARLCPTT
jgi:hypothetical protein